MNISDITINYGNGIITLPARAVTLGDRELRVMLAFASDEKLRSDYASAADNTASLVGISRAELDHTIAVLADAGLISCVIRYDSEDAHQQVMSSTSAEIYNRLPEKEKNGEKIVNTDRRISSPELEQYAGVELAELLERDGGRYGKLIEECQHTLGRIFTTSETSKLVALCDNMGLDVNYILLVCAYCKGKGKNSVRYVERTACLLVDEGVDDEKKLNAYIKERERFNSLEGRLRVMFGLGDRAITKKEREFFKCWIDTWEYGEDIIRRAYEITVERTGRAALSYLNRILENWHSSGFKTLEEIIVAEEKYKNEKEPPEGEVKSSFDTDEFFELALKRSYDKLDGAASELNNKSGVG